MKYAVLFVCTGNICRSPTAHGVFQHYIEQAGLGADCLVDSAGTHGYHVGDPPDSRSIAVAGSRGFSLEDLSARKFTSQDFHDFDLILAMDKGHYKLMEQMQPPDGRAHLAMFLDFVAGENGNDVPDPYYGGAAGFEHVLDLIERGSEELLLHIKQAL